MESKPMTYQELELISNSEPNAECPQPARRSWLGQIWESLFTFLNRKHDLNITQKTDASGNTWWKIDDPVTHQKADFASETEVMLWLEKRFYR